MRATKTASCLIFLVSVVIVSFAPAGEKWSFGFEGGWTYGSHWSTKEKTGDYSVATAAKSGFEIGAAATLKISRLFSLQSDVLYVRKGSNQVITVPNFQFGDIHVTYWLDYLEIPLLLRTYPFPEAKLKPSLVVGPYVAFQVNGQYAYRIAFLGTTKKPIKDIKTTDYGVSFGAGLDLPGRGLMMRLDYRYTMGFVDLKLPTGPDFPQIALRNYCHSVMFGFVF